MTGIDENRLSVALDAVRAQANWCPAVAGLPAYELQTLLGIAVRAYLGEPTARSAPAPRPVPPKPQPQPRKPKGPAKTPSKRVQVLDRDGWVCYLCERPIAAGEDSLDHVTPRARGGPDTMDNLKAAHKKCNHRKGHMTLAEYRAKYPLKKERTR